MSSNDPRKDEVLAWLKSTGRGYKAAARHFGIARSTIHDWAVPPGSRARTPAREKPDEPEPVVATAAWDPTRCTREEYLTTGILRALSASTAAEARNHGAVAAQWEKQAGVYRRELDELRAEEAAKASSRSRTETVPPDKLAERMLRAIPRLARVSPEVARELWLELGRAIGEWEEMAGDHADP